MPAPGKRPAALKNGRTIPKRETYDWHGNCELLLGCNLWPFGHADVARDLIQVSKVGFEELKEVTQMATIGPGDSPLPERPATASKVVEVENVGSVERLGHEPAEERKTELAAGGSMVESLAAVAAVVLAILGLADVEPLYMLTIAVIAIGVAFLAEGAAVAAKNHEESTVAEAGMNAEFLAGIAGIVLGVLALLGISELVLSAAAMLVFGGALLLSAGAAPELAATVHPDRMREGTRRATMGAAGAKVLVGLAVLVLGILALVGIEPMLLLLVAALALGAVLLFSGLAIGGRMFAALRH
jgi:hypothetical protein